MKIKITFNKWGNFYFFVQNLSGWAGFCREGHNKFWKKKLNNFNSKEKQALENFKNIRRKYQKSKSFFEKAFYKKENPWPTLEKNLFPEKYKKIKKCFSILEDKFEKIYSEEKKDLQAWKQKLNNKINNKKKEKIKEELDTLYQISSFPEKINVYLLISSPETRGGQSYIGEKSISIQITHCKKPSNYICSLVWHEISHLLTDKSGFSDLLRELSFNSRFKGNLLEASITSLFPKGILGEKFFDINLKKGETIRNDISLEKGKKLKSLSEKYLKKRNPFDEGYIKEISSLILH